MYTKEQVAYESPAKGMDHCSDCKYFRDGRCAIVSGSISPAGWCREFVMKNETKHLKQNEQAPDKFGAGSKQKPLDSTSEHQTVTSRTTGRKHEIKFGPQPGGLVPANPFASLAQEGYLHAHPEKLGEKKLAEFDRETKGKKLPKKVK